MGDVGDFVNDVWDDVTDFVEEDIFGAPSDEEQAEAEAAAAAAAAAGSISEVTDIRAARKDKLAALRHQKTKAGEIALENKGDVSKIAGMRGGSGGLKGTAGSERKSLRAKKFKESRPLRLGMKRP